MKPILMKFALSSLLISIVVLSGCNRSAPANVAATVNGRAISYADLDKQFESQFGGPGGTSSGDQAMIQKLEVLRTLIDNEIMLQPMSRPSSTS
jgi:peptidyl-prolyl cis-trans isomerase SurA